MGAALPSYSVTQIEEIATAELTRRAPGGVVTVPVDVEALIEADAAVVIDTIHGLAQGCGVEGAVWAHPAERRYTVVIDAELFDSQRGRARFTLAEELGHLVLHRDVIAGVVDLAAAIELHRHPRYYDTLDRNAKRFAAAVLMPAERLREDARDVFAELRAGGMERGPLLRTLKIRLARRYDVSVATMGHRLGEWPVEVMRDVLSAFERDLPCLPG